MLYITFDINRTVEWHVGNPLPPIPSGQRVVHFIADGDELDMVLAAMKKTTVAKKEVIAQDTIVRIVEAVERVVEQAREKYKTHIRSEKPLAIGEMNVVYLCNICDTLLRILKDGQYEVTHHKE